MNDWSAKISAVLDQVELQLRTPKNQEESYWLMRLRMRLLAALEVAKECDI